MKQMHSKIEEVDTEFGQFKTKTINKLDQIKKVQQPNSLAKEQIDEMIQDSFTNKEIEQDIER